MKAKKFSNHYDAQKISSGYVFSLINVMDKTSFLQHQARVTVSKLSIFSIGKSWKHSALAAVSPLLNESQMKSVFQKKYTYF